MKKFSLVLLSLLIVAPFHAFADAYGGPYCYESTHATSDDSPDPDAVRGTCRELKIMDVVSLDPALQPDYLLGSHESLWIDKYSEIFHITSSSTLEISKRYLDDAPQRVAVFDRSFFLPLLAKLFAASNLSFEVKGFPAVSFFVYEPTKYAYLKSQVGTPNESARLPVTKLDSLESNRYYGDGYSSVTTSYVEYGKHIYAPDSAILESQYADLHTNGRDQKRSDKDLGITYMGFHEGVPTVSLTNPLVSVADYWVYTRINGKLVLSWQKTAYTLDDGSIKTVATAEKNVGIAIGKNPSETKVASATTTHTATGTQKPPAVETPMHEGFFAKVMKWIASWFE
jgi:hypothetical protein